MEIHGVLGEPAKARRLVHGQLSLLWLEEESLSSGRSRFRVLTVKCPEPDIG
jgi:hypothetical protein